jgi:hypothetical protein
MTECFKPPRAQKVREAMFSGLAECSFDSGDRRSALHSKIKRVLDRYKHP